MFKKFIGYFTSQEETNKTEQGDEQASQRKQNGQSKNVRDKYEMNSNFSLEGDQKTRNLQATFGQQQQQQQQMDTGQNIRRKMSLQEQQIIIQKLQIYENEFSDFLILFEQDEQIKVLQSTEWKTIIDNKSMEGVQPGRIQFSLLKGIPYDVRKDVWLILSKVDELKHQNPLFIYEDMIKLEGPSDKIIMKDLNRTFADMKFFQAYDKHEKTYEGRERLFRVLRAYSHFDMEIGYTQGMNFIAASLLIHLNPDNEKDLEVEFINKEYEENIFWILVHIMKVKNWRILFLDGTPGIHIMIKTLEQKMKEYIPDIQDHIAEIGVLNLFRTLDIVYPL